MSLVAANNPVGDDPGEPAEYAFESAMSTISIAVVASTNEVATLKVLRCFSSAPISSLRRMIGTREPALEISTTDYPLELGILEGRRFQHRRIVEACEQLEDTGTTLELGYSVNRGDKIERISRTMMMNLFDSGIEYLLQEHD